MWLSGIAAVADQTEHVSGFHDLAHVYGDTAPLHMAQDDPCSSAFQNDVIADHVRTIGLAIRTLWQLLTGESKRVSRTEPS